MGGDVGERVAEVVGALEEAGDGREERRWGDVGGGCRQGGSIEYEELGIY